MRATTQTGQRFLDLAPTQVAILLVDFQLETADSLLEAWAKRPRS